VMMKCLQTVNNADTGKVWRYRWW